ncbi:helix-turn-helix transcriptional regulator [Lachnospiraceae bacterium 62-26]|jgi:AraC-like DNA-binding protein
MPIHYRNSPVNEPFVFDSIGCRWSQDRVIRPRGYPLYHYLQTEQGRGIVKVQGAEYTLNEGEGILIAPFLHHSYVRDTAQWMTAFATFTGTLGGSIDKLVANRPVIFIEKEQGMLIGELIHDITENWDSLSADPRTLSLQCYCLLMHFTNGRHARALTDEPLYLRYVAPVIKEIETGFSSELTVQELSRRVYVTPQYLSRLFRRFLGCSAYEYLTVFRINKAREFLVSRPDMEVQQIAGKTGFSDTSHFIAMFKKITGFTPLEFRKLN